MKKKFLASIMMVTLLSICAAVNIKADTVKQVKIDEVNFPGYRMRDIAATNDTDKDGYLSESEIQKITIVYFDGGDAKRDQDITSLKGIEYFTNLKAVNIFKTGITNIDLSNNKNLTKVDISNPKAQELILPKDSKITELSVGAYKQKNLDVSMLTELKKLKVISCPNIKVLDLSDNHKLRSLTVDERTTQKGLRKTMTIEKLVIGDNDNLNYMSCQLTNLKTIKIGKTPVLKSVYITNSKKLKSFNTKNMPKLRKLYIKGCGLKKLNVSNNAQLIKLDCTGNKLRALNLSKNKKLSTLTCKKNKIKKLNIKRTKLKHNKIKCDKEVKIFK